MLNFLNKINMNDTINKQSEIIRLFQTMFYSIDQGAILTDAYIDDDYEEIVCTETNEMGQEYTVVFPVDKLEHAIVDEFTLHICDEQNVEYTVRFFESIPIDLSTLKQYNTMDTKKIHSEHNCLNNTEYKLCYVYSSFAYFTTQALPEQWGDDWSDRPYETNAGAPYEYQEHDKKEGKKPWKILKVAYDGELDEPHDLSHGTTSPYSVQQINQQKVPWLTSFMSVKVEHGVHKHVQIYAGASLHEFCKKVQETGGSVYFKATIKN